MSRPGLETDSKKPIRDVTVRAYLGNHFESPSAMMASFMWMPAGETAFHQRFPLTTCRVAPGDYFDTANAKSDTIQSSCAKNLERADSPAPACGSGGVDDHGRPLRYGDFGVALSLDHRRA